MPPHKSVPKLYDLSHAATCDLVVSSCLNIEQRFSCDRCVEFDVQPCSQAVLIVQSFVRECVPSTHWGTLYHAVMKHARSSPISDGRLLHGTFIHENVDLKHLHIVPRSWPLLERPSPEVQIQLVAFWVKRAPMLKRILSLHVHDIPANEIFRAFSQHCVALKVVNSTRENMSEETFDLILQSFKGLRILKCHNFDNDINKIERLLDQLKHLQKVRWINFQEFENAVRKVSESGRKLKLRDFVLCSNNHEIVKSIVEACPELEDISFRHTPFDFPAIMRSFEHFRAHLMKFKKLEVCCREFPSAFNGFRTTALELQNRIDSKGGFVIDLHIVLDDTHDPTIALQFFSEHCRHLTNMSIITTWRDTEESSRRRWSRDLYLPKLEHFVVYSLFPNNFGWVALVNHCIAHAENLQTFVLCLRGETDIQRVETALVQLFSVNERLHQLESLNLEFHSGVVVSETLVTHVLKTCPKLRSLGIYPMTDECRCDLKQQGKEKNWNLRISY